MKYNKPTGSKRGVCQMTQGNLLTNYINRKTGILYHGSELTYSERFKSGLFQKIRSYQCNQNMPYAKEKDTNGNWIIVRDLYGKQVFECIVKST